MEGFCLPSSKSAETGHTLSWDIWRGAMPPPLVFRNIFRMQIVWMVKATQPSDLSSGRSIPSAPPGRDCLEGREVHAEYQMGISHHNFLAIVGILGHCYWPCPLPLVCWHFSGLKFFCTDHKDFFHRTLKRKCNFQLLCIPLEVKLLAAD